MSSICTDCGEKFSLLPEEQTYFQRFAFRAAGSTYPIQSPRQCPRCRVRQRCAFRNQRTLYQRKCDLCGKPHITLSAPENPRPVYCQHCFFGDGWNALDFGTEYDSRRPFLGQLEELFLRVPRLGIMNQHSVNSDYCNYSFSNKNCYLVFSSHYEEDCLYGNCSAHNRSCVDYHWIANCELSYECLFSSDLYRCVWLDHCSNCSECLFSVDLIGCRNCAFSANLRNAEYRIFNEQYSRDTYLAKLGELQLHTYSGFLEARDRFFGSFRRQFPFRAVHQVRCENCEGTNLTNSKNLNTCFEADSSEDCLLSNYLGETYDSVDVNYMGFDRCELLYQAIGCTDLFHGVCVDSCWHCSELAYCAYCFSSKNCFGCLSLQRGEYCILNKHYSKERYGEMVASILSELVNSSEWGDFFPKSFSPYGFNETVAMEWFPLSAEEARESGFTWRPGDQTRQGVESAALPNSIDAADANVLATAWSCAECGKNYKIIGQELEFYRTLRLPLPRNCIDCRQRRRLELHTPWKLCERACAKCKQQVRTPFGANRPEQVYCDSCYKQLVT